MITTDEILKALPSLIIVRDAANNIIYCNRELRVSELDNYEKITVKQIKGKDGHIYYATAYRTKKPLVYDSLSGLLEKDSFKEELKELHHKCDIERGTYSVIFGDLDHFKEINDNIGHLKADELLKKVAEVIKSNIRRDDLASRFGGDEFLIALKDTEIEEAYTKIEEIRKKMSEIIYEDVDIHNNPIRIVIQASFGIAEYEVGRSYIEILNDADMALYDAKQKGRGQVSLFDGESKKL